MTDSNSGNRNSGNRNSGDSNSGYSNSGNSNSGYYNSGNSNSGYYNSGDYNSGNFNSGDFNSGDYNSGYFNSNTSTVRIFNQDSALAHNSLTMSTLKVIINLNIKKVCVWIEEEKMSSEEKEHHPSYKTTGGFLKERDFKYCWQKGWSRMSQEDKDFITKLPNFNWTIFEEITGIKEESPKKTVSIELTDDQIKDIEKILNIKI